MNSKLLKLLLLIVATVMIVTACTSAATPTPAEVVAPAEPTKAAAAPTEAPAASTEPIYIAAIYPMTGDNAMFGEVETQAHQYVIDKINEAGGVNGRKLELVIFDDRGDPQEAANIAQKVVGDPRFVAGFGHFRSVCTLAAAPIYDAAKFLFLTDSVNEKISGISPWVFRYSITDREAGRQLIWAAVKNNPDYKNAAILYSQTDFGVGQKDVMVAELKALGVNIVAVESYFEGQSRDFTPQLTKIKGTNPDIMFVPGYYAEAAAIAQQAHQLGMTVEIWGPDGLGNVGLIELGGKDVEGVRVTSYFSEAATYPGVAETVAEYEKKWGVKPDGISAITLDATNLLIQGIKEVGADREKLREWLSTHKGFVGIAGPIEFDAKNDNLRRIVVIEVKDGKFIESQDQAPQEYFDTQFGK